MKVKAKNNTCLCFVTLSNFVTYTLFRDEMFPPHFFHTYNAIIGNFYVIVLLKTGQTSKLIVIN